MICNYEKQSCNSEKLPVQEIKSQLPSFFFFYSVVIFYVAIKLKNVMTEKVIALNI